MPQGSAGRGEDVGLGRECREMAGKQGATAPFILLKRGWDEGWPRARRGCVGQATGRGSSQGSLTGWTSGGEVIPRVLARGWHGRGVMAPELCASSARAR